MTTLRTHPTTADTATGTRSPAEPGPRRVTARRFFYVALLLLPLVTIAVLLRGQGIKTAFLQRFFPGSVGAPNHPAIASSSPGKDEPNVPVDTFVAAEVVLPNPGKVVDAATVTTGSVRLLRHGDGAVIPSQVNTSAAGDVVVLRPLKPLEPHTRYRFEVLPALKDTGGASFHRYTADFTTAAAVPAGSFPLSFEKVELPRTNGRQYMGLAIGPEGRLYAGTRDGMIHRFDLTPSGEVVTEQVIGTVRDANGAARLITGMCFDPAATAEHPVLWVSHGQASLVSAADWSGKLSRLSGPELSHYEDVLVGLPRGIRDHMNNQPVFGPDGALYFGQASLSAMGAPDAGWGNREEHVLSAAILRLDAAKLPAALPLDVTTREGGGSYDPFAPGAPLTIHASGVRNAFDLLFHSNGRLYAAVNGSAAGGNTPACPTGKSDAPRVDGAARGPLDGPPVPALQDLRMTAPDYLAVVQAGRYHGHPNPSRGEFVLNGGNPTAGADPYEVSHYPVGTPPDRNWSRPAFHFGKSLAPVGIIEYRAPRGSGTEAAAALDGALLVVRYSGGKDLVALLPAPNGTIREAVAGLDGLTGFADPLDVVQHPTRGHLYVSEYAGNRITLLRASSQPSTRVFRQVFPPTTRPAAN